MSDPAPGVPLRLLPEHLTQLRDSGISDDVIAERGYRSIDVKKRLIEVGFKPYQARTPSILIPLYGVNGDIVGYQARPDAPRVSNTGQIVKYETPAGQRQVLDVHPRVRDCLGDPSVALIITESTKKADSANSRGLCAVALNGVWGWRGTNDRGGKVALPDFDSIALNKREVYLVFDSDAMEKKPVHIALERFGAFLTNKGALVNYVYLVAQADGSKTGMDDFFASGGTAEELVSLAERSLRPLPVDPEDTIKLCLRKEPTADGEYEATPMGLMLVSEVDHGHGPETHLESLTNFDAEIVAEVIKDDGTEQTKTLMVEVRLDGRTGLIEVAPERLAFVSEWAVKAIGPEAVVYPGTNRRNHVPVAIQTLSTNVERRRVATHLGWTKLDGRDVFLHAGGGIGAGGPVAGVAVEVEGVLNQYQLPDPGDRPDLAGAVRATLACLEVAPIETMVAVIGSVLRSPLGRTDYSIYLVGATGTGKTQIAGLAQGHFGPGFETHPPVSWSSTAAYISGFANLAADMVVVVDDFITKGSDREVSGMHAKADQVLRGAGNGAGRGRATVTGQPQRERPPKCLMISTGEDLPHGESLQARMLVVQIEGGDVAFRPRTELETAQTASAEGLLAQHVTAFVTWLAGHLNEVRTVHASEKRRFITVLGRIGHARTPVMIGDLAAAWSLWLAWVMEIGVMTGQEADDLWQRIWVALTGLADKQSHTVKQAKPGVQFLALVRSALATGQARVIDPGMGDQGAPVRIIGWNGAHRGEREVWIDIEAAMSVARRLGSESGSPLEGNQVAVSRDLYEMGCLSDHQHGSSTNTFRVRRTVGKSRRWVLALHPEVLNDDGDGQVGQVGTNEPVHGNLPSDLVIPTRWTGWTVDSEKHRSITPFAPPKSQGGSAHAIQGTCVSTAEAVQTVHDGSSTSSEGDSGWTGDPSDTCSMDRFESQDDESETEWVGLVLDAFPGATVERCDDEVVLEPDGKNPKTGAPRWLL